MTTEEFEDAKALWKFFYAHECFKQVENACSFILQNKMDENHPVYYALITSIYVLYGRPFKRSNVVGKLPSDIVPPECQELHKLLLDHRDQLYAHTDAESFDLPGHGAANQVRFLVLPTEIRLFGTQFRLDHRCSLRSSISATSCRQRRVTISESFRSGIKRRFHYNPASTLSTF